MSSNQHPIINPNHSHSPKSAKIAPKTSNNTQLTDNRKRTINQTRASSSNPPPPPPQKPPTHPHNFQRFATVEAEERY